MKTTSEFVENLADVFAMFGAIEARRMFGGYGIYHDDLMFALVSDEVLYLKADDVSAGKFTDLELRPFEYMKGGKTIRISFYAAPEELFDDPEQAQFWATCAFQAALRSRKPKK
jgi:DNA transformation protein